MSDRGRYDSAMFWLAFGTAAAVIGLALMTIGVTRTSPGADLLRSPWFDAGLGLLGAGVLLLLWALSLYLLRRRAAAQEPGGPNPSKSADDPTMAEAVRGYYAERDRLFKMWDRQQRTRPKR